MKLTSGNTWKNDNGRSDKRRNYETTKKPAGRYSKPERPIKTKKTKQPPILKFRQTGRQNTPRNC